ncbi:hypothetical protein J31TS4_04230 [Paenibacillus sp. J31TS4]|uniref:GIY-YIG nuclease family protein n=1 Tax=Paenibacillus sp. J31TS4 TaxID=2807195 RepID=UPI001B136F36|nr:GIY-YIG nuclease family protein [Paenibacillus sp. J31TS4]GIP37143.1 hypothetical protein J31TS4_04230 [Paenibacillus sp. J31TS4]
MDKEQRKQAGKEYAQSHRPMGVFQLRNVKSGKVLVGGTMDLKGMQNRLLFQLRMGSHINKELQRDWQEFGEDSFRYEILEQIKPREELVLSPEDLKPYQEEVKVLEELWVEKLQPYGERGYHRLR